MRNVRDKSIFTVILISLIQIKGIFTEISDAIEEERPRLFILRNKAS